MACYTEGEEEVWKCPEHPSKRRRNGICPACLHDRLVNLCPECAKVRPCACVVSTASSSSSFACVSNLIDGETSFRRSTSVAVPFLRFKNTEQTPNNGRVKTPSFLSVLKRSKSKRKEQTTEKSEEVGANGGNSDENFDCRNRIQDFASMVTRSRSVSTGTSAMASGFRRPDANSSPAKGKFWHLPSPMKIFQSYKIPEVVVHDRSRLHRG